ncbi:hypothetical protein MTO96_042830 [Rhipicephalus appendiculatus]
MPPANKSQRRPLREARRRHSWERVRELCLLLLPERPHIVLYPKAGAECRFLLDALFFALDNVVELNVNSFHFRLDVNLEGLLLDSRLGRRLLALSVPPLLVSEAVLCADAAGGLPQPERPGRARR